MTEEREPERRHIKIESGNYNKRIQGNYIQGNYIQRIKNSGKLLLTLSTLIGIVAILGINYGNKTIATVDNFISASESVLEGEPVRITYLRMDKDGQFIQKTVSVPKGAIGAGLMPI
jgi:hypothetical protein